MKKLIKAALGTVGIDIAASSVVAIKNAISEYKTVDNEREKSFYEKYVKRPQDFFLASGALIALSPLLIGTALAVRIKLGSPVIFKQERPGKNEVVFKLFKFRTMTEERDLDGKLLPDSVRLTKFGHFLRSTSLDELPELFNIIKGDMAIIGPRPLAVQYLPFYNETEKKRHSVRPGLSGLAQVNGRTAVGWDERLRFDVEYINNISFKGDLMIVGETIKKVFRRSDIVEAGLQGDFDKYRMKQLQEKSTLQDEQRNRQ